MHVDVCLCIKDKLNKLGNTPAASLHMVKTPTSQCPVFDPTPSNGEALLLEL